MRMTASEIMWRKFALKAENLLAGMVDIGETYTSTMEVHKFDLRGIQWADAEIARLREIANAGGFK